MMIRTKKIASALGIAVALLAGTAAITHAQQQQAAPQPIQAAQPAATADRLDLRRIDEALNAAGYRDITEIELEHGQYEAKATDAQGNRVKVYGNPASGEVKEAKRKHD
ncbi:PepSY domain-containing protein [Paracandidimonas lactea]|uniref:PepSY domain-containing protein n=1 Tax=Paracandidimonas lactea TaxID=2895524 RepID=UPI001EF0D670|nr:PepSY domain-containing protein [Paracandidimonas lactea]